jgi:hypothetical protein
MRVAAIDEMADIIGAELPPEVSRARRGRRALRLGCGVDSREALADFLFPCFQR